MAAHERHTTETSIASPTLLQQLAAFLPKDVNFKIYHLSTPPTKSSAIYSAPPATRPDRTYCESHFLTASIRVPSKHNAADTEDVLVYAIEILIYSTAHSTTFFVSKADSTGYLHLLGLPKGIASPIRDISVTFLRHLVATHERPNIPSVISLFARAQDQYLFPGSVEYSGKHVLDDRGLVRWWCRVLDPLVGESSSSVDQSSSHWDSVKGYLIVPGLDSYETRSYIPKISASKTSWTMGHPLKEITRHSGDVPPRCLIPHFPDDPKSRFLDELDDELSKGQDDNSGQWRSVKTIEQFWDMMAFRQECSAGRLVGFIWVVFTPKVQENSIELDTNMESQSTTVSFQSQASDTEDSQHLPKLPSFMETPNTSFAASSEINHTSSPIKQDDSTYVSNESRKSSQQTSRSTSPSKKNNKKKLTGPIIPRQPRVKTQNKNYLLEQHPESTAYYVWRPSGRGQIVVEESDYQRVHELLLRLDFANLELATSSSKRWINEVRSGASGDIRDLWGQTVTGTKAAEVRTATSSAGVSTLNMGLVRKKRKSPEGDTQPPTQTSDQPNQLAVNVLSAGMVRKKAKV